MIRLEFKNCNAILIEKYQKYQYYHTERLINMNILQVKKNCLLNKYKQFNKLRLHTLHYEMLLQNKQKRLKSKEENRQMP